MKKKTKSKKQVTRKTKSLAMTKGDGLLQWC